jgi:hypothetical protein
MSHTTGSRKQELFYILRDKRIQCYQYNRHKRSIDCTCSKIELKLKAHHNLFINIKTTGLVESCFFVFF